MISILLRASLGLAMAQQPCAGLYFPAVKGERASICAQISKPPRSTYKVYADGTSLPDASLVNLVNQGPTTLETKQRLDEYYKHIVPSPAQRLHVKELTDNLKSSLLAEIRGDTLKDKLSSAQTKLIERVSNVKINLDSAAGTCADSLPNAFYFGKNNSVNVCASIMNYPIESLIGILSHEFAHATDPCVGLGYPVNAAAAGEVVRSKAASLTSCGVKSEFIKQNASALWATLDESRGRVGFENGFVPLYLKCGIVTGPASFLSKEELAQNPFRAEERLAEAKYSSKLQTTLDHDVVMARLIGRESGLTLDKIEDPFGGQIGCSARAEEAYADSVGARLASKYLTTYASTLNKDHMSDMLYTRVYDLCDREPGANHPPAEDRMQVYLAHPEISAALNCEMQTGAPSGENAKTTTGTKSAN